MVKIPLDSEQRYRNLLRTCPIPAFVVSRDGRWVDFNDGTVQLFGYESRDALERVSLGDLCADAAEWDSLVETLAENGAIQNHKIGLRMIMGV